MKASLFLASALILAAPISAQGPRPEFREVPPDLLDDPHFLEEIAVNEFTAPSIARIFDSLESLAPLPLPDHERELPEKTALDRADLAIELGFLIADGFLIVQAGELNRVEAFASEMIRLGNALGTGDKVRGHHAALRAAAEKGDVAVVKKELTETQKDVEGELVALRDADLAHLISLGGWIRALHVASGAVDKQFGDERAREVMREDIADYYASIIGSLEPRIAERPSFIEMGKVLQGMRNDMLLEPGESPTKEDISQIHEQAALLSKLALTRGK